MNKYKVLKQSGIAWIGEMPGHWGFKRLKNSAYINRNTLGEGTPYDYFIDYVDIGNTNDKGEFSDVQEIEFGEAPSRARRKVESGDTIISTVRTYLRAIAFIENPKENLIVSTGFAVLSPHRTLLTPKFQFYQVLCDSFIQRVIANSDGVSYPAISSTKLGEIKLFLPPIEEQLSIVKYLDAETKTIDILITKKRTEVQKLKELRLIELINVLTKGLNPNVTMKPSGVEWIGDIPKHWDVKRLKNVTAIKYGNSLNIDVREEGDIPVYGSNGIVDCHNIGCTTAPCIIIGRKGSYGKLNFSDVVCFPIDTAFFIDESCTNKNLVWLYFLLQCLELDSGSQDSAVPGLSREVAYNKRVGLPPKEEQNEIANYLKQKIGGIDMLINNIDSQIEKLLELRRIKIYEAVTGKIRINQYVEATA